MTPDQIRRIDAGRQPGCRHPTAASGKISSALVCGSCGVDYYEGELEFHPPDPPFVPRYASDEQAARIDSQRSSECRHERASERRPWCLICVRCGVAFSDGVVRVIAIETEAADARDGVTRCATLGYAEEPFVRAEDPQ